MKRMFLFSLILLGMGYGCRQADVTTSISIPETSVVQLQRIEINNPLPGSGQFVLVEAIVNTPDLVLRGNVHKATGHFLSSGEHLVSFSAIENKGGTHGQAEINGPIYDMHLETMCLAVSGNRATVAGIITQIQNLPANFPVPLDVGYQFYYAVEDNGEGNGSGHERSHAFVYIGPPEAPPLCDFLLPDDPIYWPEAFWFNTIGEHDQVDVK